MTTPAQPLREHLRDLRSVAQKSETHLRRKWCGRKACSTIITAAKVEHGGIRWSGIETCGSIWQCPVCASVIKYQRAKQVRTAVQTAGERGGTHGMLTLTVRHAMGDDLERLRRGVAETWRRTIQGKAWRQTREDWGAHYIRAAEVTYGQNGWHPHLHVLWVAERDLGAAEWMAFKYWISDRWTRAVERVLGPAHLPDPRYAVRLSIGSAAEYVSKLGLEITGAPSKVGRKTGRTPYQLLEESLRTGRRSQAWKAYAAGMVGARHLTWSRGAKADLIPEEPEPDGPAILPALMLTSKDWYAAKDRGLVRAIEDALRGEDDAPIRSAFAEQIDEWRREAMRWTYRTQPLRDGALETIARQEAIQREIAEREASSPDYADAWKRYREWGVDGNAVTDLAGQRLRAPGSPPPEGEKPADPRRDVSASVPGHAPILREPLRPRARKVSRETSAPRTRRVSRETWDPSEFQD